MVGRAQPNSIKFMSAAKQEILARIRTAAGPPPTPRGDDYADIPRHYVQAGTLDLAARLHLFIDRLQDYGAAVYPCAEHAIAAAVAYALTKRGKSNILIPRDLQRAWLPDEFIFLSEGADYLEIDASEGVLTDCALAIASTGTIVLRHGPGEARRALSLIPDYHLCIIHANQVVETVPEGIRLMRPFAQLPITTISGPSATSDIEMTRVKGVHGPRTLDVVLAAP